MQTRTLTPCDMSNTYTKDADNNTQEFCHFTKNSDMGDQKRELWVACESTWNGSEVFKLSYLGHKSPDLDLRRSFPDAPFFNLGSGHIHSNASDFPPELRKTHQKLHALHEKVYSVLGQIFELLMQASAQMAELLPVLNGIKNSGRLLEVMPEAMTYLPSGFGMKVTKEVADPKAINEIRAKLAAGLPI